MRKTAIKFFSYFVSMFFLSVPAHASRNDYTIKNGDLEVYGYILKPKYPIRDSDSITFNSSHDGEWIIIKSGYRVKVDLWLYNTHKKTKPIPINIKPGNHTRVIWHKNDVVEIRWGGMGYSISNLFRVNNINSISRIEDLISYDVYRNIYVSYSSDKIYVGRLFNKCQQKPLSFDIKLEYKSIIDAPSAIVNIQIKNNFVFVQHKKLNGSLVIDKFSIKGLCR